ncbi:MAG: translation initiation factor IF-2 [Fusobacteria bacterium]|nr:translation initiation factor IF-2 [Fusobacteriota bacterium]
MSKKRVYELAKEYNVGSKEFVEKLHEIGLDVKSHMSAMEDTDVTKVKAHFEGKKPQESKAKEPVAPSENKGENATASKAEVPPQSKKQSLSGEEIMAMLRQEKRQERYASNQSNSTNENKMGSNMSDNKKNETEEKSIEPSQEAPKPYVKREHDPNAPRPPYDPNKPRPPYDPNKPRAPYDPNRPRPVYDPNKPRPPYDPNKPRAPYDPNRPRPAYDPNAPRPVYDPNKPRPPYDPNRPRPAYDPNAPRPVYDPNKPRAPYDPNRPRPVYDPNKPRPPYDPNRPAYNSGGFGKDKDGGDRPNFQRKPVGKFENKNASDEKVDVKSVMKEVRITQTDKKNQATKKIDKLDKFEEKQKGKKHDKQVKHLDVRTDVVEEKKEDEIKNIVLTRPEISVGEFAEKLKVKPSEIIKKLFLQGHMLTINSVINLELAEELALGYNALIEVRDDSQPKLSIGERFALEVEDREENVVERAPIITIMGHVDHGKTSLLDAFRQTQVAEGETGGITQKIGAYQVKHEGKKITFIDTPGHEAFTEMRARGAAITDIAILIVAADDGVKPQTIEAIAHAKDAKVPIIVAVNKIDKPGADASRVKQQLLEHELVPVEYGGDVEFVEVSAKKRLNLDTLLETILLTAEILDLKSDPKKRAKGTVLESRLDPQLGAIVDLIVTEGTLRIGDIILADKNHGRVKIMINDKGDRIESAIPGQPVEIVGFNTVPNAGDILYVLKKDKDAKRIINEIDKVEKLSSSRLMSHMTLDMLSQKLDDQKLKELKLIIKGDSRGSVEALKESLLKLSNEEVKVIIVHATPGAITEGDVTLAEASGAIIIGFHVRPSLKAKNMAEARGVEIRTYGVIYHITEEIESAIKGMLTPKYKEVYLGQADVKEAFKITNVGMVAGCIVTDGKILKTAKVRVLRDGVVIHTGDMVSLKRFKDDVKDVSTTQECGITVQDYNDIKSGDVIEAFEEIEIKQ